MMHLTRRLGWLPSCLSLVAVMVMSCKSSCQAATVAINRDAVDSSFFQFLDSEEEKDPRMTCAYAGSIQLSHPMSVGRNDRYYVLGSQMLEAAHMSIDAINMWPRCGLSLADGKNYSLSLQTYGDSSSTNKTADIGRAIVNRTDVMLAGYSSTLTEHLTPIAHEEKRLCVTAGSSRTSVHAERDFVFGLLPTSGLYLDNVIRGVKAQGAKTIAYVTEEDVNSCLGAPEIAEKYGMEFINGTIIPEESPAYVFDQVALTMAQYNPDVVITCIRSGFGDWMQAMRKIDWTPKAQVFTIVVGTPEFEDELGTDLSYIMGVTSWDRALPPIPDGATGWTPYDFDAAYEQVTFRRPAYQHTSQSAAISVVAQAMERIGTLPWEDDNWATKVRDTIATGFFPTVYGNVSFDENGQSAVPYLFMQYDHNHTLHVLLPEDRSYTDFDGVYPLPTWANRDCETLSVCVATNGTCTVDGLCQCPEQAVSEGKGPTAQCVVHEKDKTSLIIALAIVIPLVIIGVAFMEMRFFNKKVENSHDDSVWKVQKEDLLFADPPEVVGSGTFGLVLKAEYRGTTVAVKRVLPPQYLKNRKRDGRTSTSFDVTVESDNVNNSTALKRGSGGAYGRRSIAHMDSGEGRVSYGKLKQEFIEEMRYISNLRHPCITTVMGAVIDPNEEPMLVMEYMEHGSLCNILHNETMMLEGELLLPMLQDISQGCRFLHSANPQVIHGDLKAANVLVDSKFRAKVADFGLSQKQQTAATGSPYWMAPELLRGESLNTAASDVYSFGIILFECFSRQAPYEGEDDANEVLQQIANPEINRRPPVPKDCPPQIASLMCDCIVAKPEERPTFEEVDTRLKRVNVEAAATNALQSAHRDRTTISIFDIFPQHIAEALQDGKQVEAEHKDLVTIFFSDIVGFTNISSDLEPMKVASMLDRLYSKFDALSDKHDIFKVETIGDAYMAVTNLVKDQSNDHVRRIAEFAVDTIQAANDTLIDEDDPSKGHLSIRVGFHSGPVVADVVGSRNPRYCLFGDTVNTASRMESHSKVNRILCSETAADLLKKQDCKYPVRSRGKVQMKGKGDMHCFWVTPTTENDQDQEMDGSSRQSQPPPESPLVSS